MTFRVGNLSDFVDPAAFARAVDKMSTGETMTIEGIYDPPGRIITVWTRTGRYWHWGFVGTYDAGGRAFCGFQPKYGWYGQGSGRVSGRFPCPTCRAALDRMKR